MNLLLTVQNPSDIREKLTKEEARELGIEAVVYGYSVD